MLKSDWKELPDWQNETDYAFLDDAPLEVWVWEFLRRSMHYRRYWHRWENCRNHDKPVYRPRKRVDESAEQWWRRIALEQNIDAKPVSLKVHWGRAWQLDELYDPRKPFEQGVTFLPIRQSGVVSISRPDELEPFLICDETGSGNSVVHVQDQYAIYAFDLTLPVTEQLEKVKAEMLQKAKQLAKAKVPKLKSQVWKRHLRALDAERADLKPSGAEIGKLLFGDDSCKVKLAKQGYKVLEKARSCLKNYRDLLHYKGDLPKINNSTGQDG